MNTLEYHLKTLYQIYATGTSFNIFHLRKTVFLRRGKIYRVCTISAKMENTSFSCSDLVFLQSKSPEKTHFQKKKKIEYNSLFFFLRVSFFFLFHQYVKKIKPNNTLNSNNVNLPIEKRIILSCTNIYKQNLNEKTKRNKNISRSSSIGFDDNETSTISFNFIE